MDFLDTFLAQPPPERRIDYAEFISLPEAEQLETISDPATSAVDLEEIAETIKEGDVTPEVREALLFAVCPEPDDGERPLPPPSEVVNPGEYLEVMAHRRRAGFQLQHPGDAIVIERRRQHSQIAYRQVDFDRPGGEHLETDNIAAFVEGQK